MMLEAMKFYRDAISIVASHFNDQTCPSSYLHRCATPMTSCIYYEVTPIHPAPLTPIVTSLVGILWSPDGGVSLLSWYISNPLPYFSLMCVVAKALERYMYSRLLPHFENIIHVAQYGFVRGKSCTSQLLSVFHQISQNLDLGKQTDILQGSRKIDN